MLMIARVVKALNLNTLQRLISPLSSLQIQMSARNFTFSARLEGKLILSSGHSSSRREPAKRKSINRRRFSYTYPARPPDSILFASVTSSLQTSNCHFLRPSTPHNTLPECIPIRISILLPVASRTNLQLHTKREEHLWLELVLGTKAWMNCRDGIWMETEGLAETENVVECCWRKSDKMSSKGVLSGIECWKTVCYLSIIAFIRSLTAALSLR